MDRSHELSYAGYVSFRVRAFFEIVLSSLVPFPETRTDIVKLAAEVPEFIHRAVRGNPGQGATRYRKL